MIDNENRAISFKFTHLLQITGLAVTVVLTVLAGQAQAATAYTSGSVNLRQGPGPRYAKLMTLPRGTAVHVNSCRASWCHINSRWGQGWLSANYLRPVAGPRVQGHVGVYIQPRYRSGYERYWAPEYRSDFRTRHVPRYSHHYGPVYPPMPAPYVREPRRGYNPYDNGPDAAPPLPGKWNPAWGVGPAHPPIGSGVVPQ